MTLSEWQGWDGTRMDLSTFTSLKTLKAPAYSFFGTTPPGPSRNGLYKLLPRSLKHLYLSFCTLTGIFYLISPSTKEIDPIGRSAFTSESMSPNIYAWILELARHQREFLPMLKSVVLKEDLGWMGLGMWKSEAEEWDPPLEVDWAFDEAGVELDIRVRREKGTV